MAFWVTTRPIEKQRVLFLFHPRLFEIKICISMENSWIVVQFLRLLYQHKTQVESELRLSIEIQRSLQLVLSINHQKTTDRSRWCTDEITRNSQAWVSCSKIMSIDDEFFLSVDVKIYPRFFEIFSVIDELTIQSLLFFLPWEFHSTLTVRWPSYHHCIFIMSLSENSDSTETC